MGKTLYLDCSSGMSGDMMVGALLDLGANEAGLRRALESLNVDGYEVVVTRKLVSGIDACDFDVVLDDEHESHDHDMDYLYGNLDEAEAPGHDHDNGDDDVHEHHHKHRHGRKDRHHRKGRGHKHGHKHEFDHDHEHGPHDHAHGHEHGSHDHDHSLDHEPHDHQHEGGEKGIADAHEHGHGHKRRGWIHAHVFGQNHVHDHEHRHDHEHAHDHDLVHGHEHHHHHHHHEHRSPADIAAIIDAADLAPRAKAMAHRIFDIVAQAEAKAHGLPIEEVHFHEVGAVDSIVDVVSVAYCLDDLDVTDAYVTPLAEGHGRVRCAHGVLPVPVPAVTHIVADNGLVLQPRDMEGELVTPTGAAIAAAVRTMDVPPAAYRVVRTGLGSGKRAYDPPSTVRTLIIEEVAEQYIPQQDQMPQQFLGMPDLWKLETELDDCTGEALGHVAQLLYAAGALEVHCLPVYMKKNRPGYQIEILCGPSKISELEAIVFENTTTIGIRRCPEWRTALPREARDVETPLGMVRVKVVTLPSGAQRAYPEHDSVKALSRDAHVSYQEALRVALAAIEMEE